MRACMRVFAVAAWPTAMVVVAVRVLAGVVPPQEPLNIRYEPGEAGGTFLPVIADTFDDYTDSTKLASVSRDVSSAQALAAVALAAAAALAVVFLSRRRA